MPVFYTIGKGLALFSFNTFGRFRVEGREAVPPTGPVIVVSNHLSNADPAVLAACIPRRLHFLAKRGLFANRIVSKILRDLGVYPLDRDGRDVSSVIWTLHMLKRDQAVAMFPEGTRSKDAQLHRAIVGTAYIALRSQAPVLPVSITGTEKIPGFWRVALPLCTIRVRIGQPFTLPVIEGKPSRELLESLADMIMYRVAELLPERYRGYYQFRPRHMAHELPR